MAQGQYRKPEPLPVTAEPIPSRYKMFSPRQASLNKMLKKDGLITNEQAAFVDQGTMNSFCRRGFLLHVRGGYTPSPAWYRAIDEFEHAEIVKDHASDHLGKWVAMLRTVRSINRGAA